MRLPTQRLSMSTASKRFLAGVLGMMARAAQAIFPRQCNRFAFVVTSNGDKPWIKDNALRKDFALGFNPEKYVRSKAARSRLQRASP
jgi:hypothetical protein